MSSSSLVRFGGGLASAAAGILLLLGHVLNLGGDPEYGTVPGASSVLVAHIILVVALVALYAAQADESGLLGSLGMVLGVIGTTLVSGAEVDALFAAGVSGMLSVLGGLAFFIGLILFGIATMRAGVFPRWAGLLLIVGDIVFGAGDFTRSAAPVVFVVGALITCAGFVWLGVALLSGRSGVSSQQPGRVS